MHPILSNRERLLIYLLGWLALALLLIVTMTAGRFSWPAASLLVLPLALVAAFLSMSTWFLCLTFPIRETPSSRLFAVHAIAAGSFSAMLLFLTQGWSYVLTIAAHLTIGLETSDLRLIFGAGVLLYLLVAAVHYLLAAFESSRLSDRKSFESQLLARDSELKALRAQIDPHFLFNSLNSISALTTADPASARAMTVQLAEFFRSSLAAGRMDLITIDEEVDMIDRYLAIERVRFGDRLRVELSIDPSVRTCRVPPLILQPLVENAVKHGIAHVVDGGTVTIRGGLSGNFLLVSVTNPFEAQNGARRSGTSFGLTAVRERLRAIAGDDGRLVSGGKEGLFTADVYLPADL